MFCKLVNGRLTFRVMNAPVSNAKAIEELNDKLVKLAETAKSMRAQADAENRPFTPEEEAQFDAINKAFEATEAEIAQRQKIDAMEAKLAAPVALTVPPAAASSPAAAAKEFKRIEPVVEARGAWGWRSMGEFARAVKAAGRGHIDPRLAQGERVLNAPSPLSSEGAGADGGYAVPPDFRTDIQKKVFTEDSLLGRTDLATTSGNQLVVPTDETTPWQSTGGILAYWEGEGAQIQASKPALQNITVRANKLSAIVPVTDELLEDASALGNYIQRKAPEKFEYRINDALINGTGAGMPLGMLNAGCKVTITAESGQGAGTVKFANVNKMWAAMYAPWRQDSIWLINQDVEPQLQNLQITGTSSGVFPAYLPPGGLSGAPYATLFGRPIIPMEACAALGTEGDIILTNMKQYLSVVKAGGVRQDISIHLWFDYDTTAFRFIMRIGGQPWWKTTIARAKGAQVLGPIITLNSTRT